MMPRSRWPGASLYRHCGGGGPSCSTGAEPSCRPCTLAALLRRARVTLYGLLAAEFVMRITAPFQHRAAAVGLTEALVRRVISAFYDKVRRDAVLGPVFAEAIGSDWAPHIEKINQFWLTATRLGGGYESARFLPAHMQHSSIRADQIPQWLRLFRETAGEYCSPEAAAVLVDIAERMAETIAVGLARRDG
jgi:hemoglobin